jgi:trigger factor
MKIQKKDIDQLNTTLSIEIEKEDYLKKFNDELKNYKGKASLKGFRKGKTPLGFIKKMFGKGILADAVNESLQKGLFDYIKDQDLNVLGDPLPSESQEMIDFDVNNLGSFTFDFDLGLSPDITVKGAASTDSYTHYDITLTDEIVNEEIEVARKRQGSQEEVAEDIKEKDILKIQAIELENGLPKEGGHETDFTLMTDLIA